MIPLSLTCKIQCDDIDRVLSTVCGIHSDHGHHYALCASAHVSPSQNAASPLPFCKILEELVEIPFHLTRFTFPSLCRTAPRSIIFYYIMHICLTSPFWLFLAFKTLHFIFCSQCSCNPFFGPPDSLPCPMTVCLSLCLEAAFPSSFATEILSFKNQYEFFSVFYQVRVTS